MFLHTQIHKLHTYLLKFYSLCIFFMPINKSTYFINTKKNFIASHGIIACCLCTSFSMLASFSPKTTTLHSIRNFEITNFKQNEKKKKRKKKRCSSSRETEGAVWCKWFPSKERYSHEITVILLYRVGQRNFWVGLIYS